MPEKSPNKIATAMIQNFIRENLEIGWSHLEYGNLDLAKHHFTRAIEQVDEIASLCSGASTTAASQPTLDI